MHGMSCGYLVYCDVLGFGTMSIHRQMLISTVCHMSHPPMQEALDHTEEQIEDLMYVRHLFYAQLGQLARDRKSLLSKMLNDKGVGVSVRSHASDRLSELTKWTEQLRKNAAHEYHVYLQFAVAFYRGVSCVS